MKNYFIVFILATFIFTAYSEDQVASLKEFLPSPADEIYQMNRLQIIEKFGAPEHTDENGISFFTIDNFSYRLIARFSGDELKAFEYFFTGETPKIYSQLKKHPQIDGTSLKYHSNNQKMPHRFIDLSSKDGAWTFQFFNNPSKSLRIVMWNNLYPEQ